MFLHSWLNFLSKNTCTFCLMQNFDFLFSARTILTCATMPFHVPVVWFRWPQDLPRFISAFNPSFSVMIRITSMSVPENLGLKNTKGLSPRNTILNVSFCNPKFGIFNDSAFNVNLAGARRIPIGWYELTNPDSLYMNSYFIQLWLSSFHCNAWCEMLIVEIVSKVSFSWSKIIGWTFTKIIISVLIVMLTSKQVRVNKSKTS